MRKTGRSFFRSAGLLLTALLFSSLLMSCGQTVTEKEAPELLDPVGVVLDTEIAAKGEFVNYVSYEGSVTPRMTELYFTADGTLAKLNVYQGQYVEEGTLLASLDQEGLEKQVESLQNSINYLLQNGSYEDQIADLEIQMLQVELQELQAGPGASSQPYKMKALEIERAAAARNQAAESRNVQLASLTAQMEELKSKAAEQNIYAPHDGHIYFSDKVSEGASVRGLRTIMYLTDPSDLTFVVSGEAVSDTILRNGLYYAQVNGEEWKVSYKELTADEKNAYAMKRVVAPTNFTFDKDISGKLEAGMTGVLVGELVHLTDVITVPNSSLMREGMDNYLYVMENGMKVKRIVEPGRSNGIRTIIEAGLQEGEEIYVPE